MTLDGTQMELGVGPVFTTEPVDRSGMARYTHLIWGLNDPKRSERPQGGRADKHPTQTMRRSTEDHGARIRGLLSDGVPRTFNRIGVELWDQEASMLTDGPVDAALWRLVAEQEIEHTMEAPILFRRKP